MKQVLLALLLTTAALQLTWAQSSCDTADNLITNCGFDTGTNGWVPSEGFISHDTEDGAEQPGALQIRGPSANSRATQSACVNSQPVGGRTFEFGGSYRVTTDSLLNFCRVDVTEYDGTACSGSEMQHLASSQGFPSMSAVFSDVSSEFTAREESQSMRVRLDCSQNFGSHTINWDDIYLREQVLPPPDGDFATSELDADVTPLEVDMAQMGPPGSQNDLLIIQLWNNALDDNRLTAFRVPAPFDGTGVTSTDIDAGSLFGLNLCVLGEEEALLVYTKDFNTQIAQYDGNTWTTNTLAATEADEFHYADCAVTASGTVIQSLNATRNRLDVFKRPHGPSKRKTKGAFDEFALAFSIGDETIPGGPLSPFFGGIPTSADSSRSIFDAALPNTYDLLVMASTDSRRRLGPVDADTGDSNLVPIGNDPSRKGSGDGTTTDGHDSHSDSDSGSDGDRSSNDSKVVTVEFRSRRWLALKTAGTGMVYRIEPNGNQTVVNLGPSQPGLFVRNRVTRALDGNLYRFARRAFTVDRESLEIKQIGAYPFSAGGGLADILLPFNTIALAGNAGGLSLSLLRPDVAFVSTFER